ncbi:MAG: protein kinase [Acidobacteriota bacterium]
MLSETIGHYRIIRKLGQGGMGEVYLAEDTRLSRKVAIKFIPEELVKNEQVTRRLIREARAAATLDHPNICSVYEVGECEGGNFIVMQYVEGENVYERNRRKPLDLRECLQVAYQVADALGEAHSQGIIHRDLKPQNIMITARGHVKLLDFGLAKIVGTKLTLESAAATETLLSEPGMVIGTVPYMSPEQVRGEEIDARSDIFSLGVVLYELVTGRRPFFNDSATVTISEILTREPPPLARYTENAPPEMQRIINKALCKDAEERYQTAKDLQVDLKNLMSELAFEEKLERSYSGYPGSVTSGLRRAVSTGGISPASSFGVPEVRSRKRAILIALAVVAVAAAGIGSYLFFFAAGDSLAVLPFTYTSSDPRVMADPDREYVSDGITESLIDSLSQLPKLKVIARSSVFRYKGKDADAQTVGRELGVRTVLVGTITQRGDTLTIITELVKVSDNSHIGGGRYERKVSGLLALQSEIVREISEKLRMTLTGSDREILGRQRTDSAEAYQAYLKGRYHWNKRNEEGLKKGIEFFQQAISIDSKYALAYTGIADCYILLSDYGFMPPSDGYPKARTEVMKALEIDEKVAEAHTSLAATNTGYYWEWDRAESEFKRALELNPNYPTAHHWYALHLMLTGRMDEALGQIQQARDLDPLSRGINKDYGIMLFFARRYNQAIEQFKKTLEIDPAYLVVYTHLAEVYIEKGMYGEAIAELERVHALSPDDYEITSVLGQAYAAVGRKDEAQKIAAQLNSLEKGVQFLSKEMAILYTRLGDKDRAIEVLQNGVEKRHAVVTEIKVDPRLDSLRADPRFAELLRRIGLPN